MRRVSSSMALEVAFFIVASVLPLAGIVTADGPVDPSMLDKESITSETTEPIAINYTPTTPTSNTTSDVNATGDADATDARTLANALVIASKPDGRAKKIVPESGDDGWWGS